ncbi:MAG TPA: hypothetical protein VJ464_29910 [Blastocatellia bacterium]|nr:hypothetical protein [Blastocatellia bacterium]
MTLAEATAQWLEAMARDDSVSQECDESRALSLSWLVEYAGPRLSLAELTPARVRDFLGRWFIDHASIPARRSRDASEMSDVTEVAALANTLAAFTAWAARVGLHSPDDCRAIIEELRERVPRALAISSRLSERLADRRGAFGFPEFLTSFEAGGHSQYDLDEPGESGCLEGYFRILRVEGCRVEAEDMLTEMRVWPILFPADVAAQLEPNYIINLELLRTGETWQIAACGFAYPPNTEV